MDKFNINPFDRSALTDYKLLAARKNEFTQIRSVLRNSLNQQNRIKSILINGERGVGKTSFLNLIEAECIPNNIIPIRIDLTDTNSKNSNEFFWLIFSQLTSKLFNLGLLGGKGGLIDASIQKILFSNGLDDLVNYVFRTPIIRKHYSNNPNSIFEFDYLIEDLKIIRKHLPDPVGRDFNEKTKFYFLVDESQKIYTNTNILEEIRFIIQHQDLGFGFVFAGDSTYIKSEWESVFGGSQREFEIVCLDYFSEPESIADYFKKSLESVGWSTDEIEDKLFYRFKYACRHIFFLTSGRPAWINIIASKMFERCMNGESPILKFDKQALADVKKILEDSGQIDNNKLELIQTLPKKFQKWLSFIFSCELSTLEKVYFYAKFIFVNENYLSLKDFETFCKDLVDLGIINFFDDKKDSKTGFNKDLSEKNILIRKYYIFEYESITIKQWLQLNSDGKFSFEGTRPDIKYAKYINSQLLEGKYNAVIISRPFVEASMAISISQEITKIDREEYSVSEETYDSIEILYRFLKKLSKSTERQTLYGVLKNVNTGKIKEWNVYNYDDHGKLAGFVNYPNTLIKKFTDIVKSYKTEDQNFELELVIEKIGQHNIEKFQNLIIKSNDTRKIGIILSDKIKELTESYISKSDMQASYKAAIFINNLFSDGHELNLYALNNAAYVFLSKNELDKAEPLLLEAKRKILADDFEKDDLYTACLVLYNLGMLDAIKQDYKKSLKSFKELLEFTQAYEDADRSAGVLNILQKNENNEICITEIRDGDHQYPEIDCKLFAEINISLIESLN